MDLTLSGSGSRLALAALLLLTLLAAGGCARLPLGPGTDRGSSTQAASTEAALARWASGRRLAQAPAAATTEGPAEPAGEAPALSAQDADSQSGQACLDLQITVGASCQVAIDRLARIFPRGSTELPTPQQQQEAVAALVEGGLPVDR